MGVASVCRRDHVCALHQGLLGLSSVVPEYSRFLKTRPRWTTDFHSTELYVMRISIASILQHTLPRPNTV